jgi:O-antigen ligase
VESPDGYLDGSPFDRNVFFTLIMLGLVVLFKRRVSWSRIRENNAWILVYFVYCGLSAFWSDYPLVSFKRWSKEIGNLVMVFIVLSEIDPIEALSTIMRRCAYILLPMSVVLIKYFSHLGRAYSQGGIAMYTGVTSHKNSLGMLCMASLFYFFWNYLMLRQKVKPYLSYKKEYGIHILFFLMAGWLLYMSSCSTAILATAIGIGFLLLTELPIVRTNIKYINFLIIFLVVVFFVVELDHDTAALVAPSLGRDATLTGRTQLWDELMAMKINRVVGTGYESFWLGDRAQYFWDKYWWHPNQAHNGYLEIYLNLGCIGLFLLMGMLCATYRAITKKLLMDLNHERLKFIFLIIFFLVNITEAYIRGLSLMWFILLLIATEYPQSESYSGIRRTIPVRCNRISKSYHLKNSGLKAHALTGCHDEGTLA